MKNKLFLIFILAVLFFTRQSWLPWPGLLLIVPDKLEKADCLVSLRGDDVVRFQRTVSLFNEGYSPNIVVSLTPGIWRDSELIYRVSGLNKIPNKELTLKFFEYFGKNSDRIFFTNSDVTSTFEEAIATKQLMQQEGFKSLILVTSEYHMRRALLIFKWVFRNTGIQIYNATAESGYEPSVWWRREGDLRRVVEEYGSFVINFIQYGFNLAAFQ